VRLTKLEKEAVVDVLNERLAGGAEDLRDALGLTMKEAERMTERLQSALEKLITKQKGQA